MLSSRVCIALITSNYNLTLSHNILSAVDEVWQWSEDFRKPMLGDKR